MVALVASAYLMAAALGFEGYRWAAWFSLLPLFAAVRMLRPREATVWGGFWGFCLFLFSVTLARTAIPPTVQSLVVLTAVPAGYALLGAILTRRFGFNPLVLGLGWVGVEFGLKPLGLPHGLLAGTQGGGTFLHLVGGVLGFVFVAFVIASANAVVLSAFHSARAALPRLSVGIPVCDSREWVHERASSRPSVWIASSFRARAPPVRTI